MRSVQSWLDEYQQSHSHPVNEIIHWICIPLIMLSTIGLLWAVPLPGPIAAHPLLNLGTITVAGALAWYMMMNRKLAVGMALWSGALLAIDFYLASRGVLVFTSVALFVGAWLVQLWGHKVEGKKPSFFKDLQFLLIGPLWLLSAVYRKLGITY